ncbi:unnamed protein product [Clonostachys solani]|uniref:Uncharacterized protein n=1 Tax=Clonostachys solani TaxID=160281 RepID=A0A9N9ZE65_9HYPO|nr:unnamed protein product [Clonostachys solani]
MTLDPAETLQLSPAAGCEGEDADDIARSQLDKYYSEIGLWGSLRWLLSIVLLSASARIVDIDSIPSLKPFAIFNVVCACIHLVTVSPLLKRPHSATNPRPPTVWLVQFISLMVLNIVALALSIVMMVMAYEFRKEKHPSGGMCRHKGGHHRPCMSDRSATFDMCVLSFCISIAIMVRFTARQIQERYEYIMAAHAAVDSMTAWKSCWAQWKVFMRGWRAGMEQK